MHTSDRTWEFGTGAPAAAQTADAAAEDDASGFPHSKRRRKAPGRCAVGEKEPGEGVYEPLNIRRETSGGASPLPVLEVVHCDACGLVIGEDNDGGRDGGGADKRERGFSCLSCFDYDLCADCYSNGTNDHVKSTGHSFRSF